MLYKVCMRHPSFYAHLHIYALMTHSNYEGEHVLTDETVHGKNINNVQNL